MTASFLPGHEFSEGVHNVLYIATDVDGNKVCMYPYTRIKDIVVRIIFGRMQQDM